MRHTRIRIRVAAAVLALAIAGCGGTGGTNAPRVKLTVPGSPSAQVTDVIARGLTKEQADEIRRRCQVEAPIPGTDEDCVNALYILKSPCTKSSFCFETGFILGTQLAVMQISPPEQVSSPPACQHENAIFCKGIVVPAAVVAPLIGTPTVSPSVSPTSSEPTLTPTPTITPTPTPTTGTLTPTPTPTVSPYSPPPVS
jgi:hypothetical protein